MKASSIGSFDSFWKVAIVTGGIAAWSLPVWNVVVDPYQIFNTKFSIGDRYTSSTTNERYLKVEYLLKEAKKTSRNTTNAIVEQINDESAQEFSKNIEHHSRLLYRWIINHGACRS